MNIYNQTMAAATKHRPFTRKQFQLMAKQCALKSSNEANQKKRP